MNSFMTAVMFLATWFVQAMTIHPIHVSVTEIEYDKKDETFEIMMRVFVEDLENDIRKNRKLDYLDLLHPAAPYTTKELIGNYLGENFMVSIDGKRQSIQYLGQELEGEAIICYLICSNVQKWKSIEVFNNVLVNTYDDQSNIVHVIIGDDVKSMRLIKDKTKGTLTFDPD